MAVNKLESSGFNYPAATNGAETVARLIIMSGTVLSVCVLELLRSNGVQ